MQIDLVDAEGRVTGHLGGVGSALFFATAIRADGPLYTDANYDYYGTAAAGTDLTVPLWSVSRVSKATNRRQWVALGTETQLYTSLAVVAALTYT